MSLQNPISPESSTQVVSSSQSLAWGKRAWFNWKSFLLGAIATFTLVSVTAGVFAHRMRRGHWMANQIAQTLQLTTDQKAQLRTIWQEAHTDTAQNRAVMKQLREKVVALLKQDKPSKPQLDELVIQFFDNAKRIALSKTGYFLRAHDVLSPEQRQRIHQKAEKIRNMMKKRHQRYNKTPGQIPAFLK